MPLPFDEIIDKQLTQFFERTHYIWKYLTEPHSCWPFKSGREGSIHNLVWNPLNVHCSLESSNMIERVTRPIIRIQGRHLELWRQGVIADGSCERGDNSVN